MTRMNFDDYQAFARSTWVDTSHGPPERALSICALGAAGEAGELADKWKKVLHYKDGNLSVDDMDAMIKEAGDVLWYLANLASEFGIPFSSIAEMNMEKLADRKRREMIRGEGDDR